MYSNKYTDHFYGSFLISICYIDSLEYKVFLDQIFKKFLMLLVGRKKSREIPHHTHNFSNLKTHQNASESFFVEFSGSNQNPTLTSSKVG